MITGLHGMLPRQPGTSKGLPVANRLAAPRRISPGKYRQPNCADPVAGAAAALQPDANDAATAIEQAINNRALEEGVRTGDLAVGAAAVSTDEMGDSYRPLCRRRCNHGQNVIRKLLMPTWSFEAPNETPPLHIDRHRCMKSPLRRRV